MKDLLSFWGLPTAEVLEKLQTTATGLPTEEARQRLDRLGPNLVKSKARHDFATLLWAQFKSPIILLLALAAVLSFFLHEQTTAIIVITIIIASGLLGFWQEYGATNAVEKLIGLVEVKATVLRDSNPVDIPVKDVVPGDIVILKAGDIIPGDCLLLESHDLFIDEAVLTGETYPVEKVPGVLSANIPLKERRNSLFMGTHTVSGSAKAVVVNTGLKTELGKIAHRLELRPPETDFERGIRRFGYLLMELTLLLVITIFAINVYLARPILDSFLFSLALAVGLTPQLLPAIIGVNLARGAKTMAQHKVIVKRLASIENFGSMNVLCSDKTGTLTEGNIRLHSAEDAGGNENKKVLLFAYINATYETGYVNPIDEAIRTYRKFDISAYTKLDEIPFDFVRKRISVLASTGDTRLLLMKGALPNVLAVCSRAEMCDNTTVDMASIQKKLLERFEELSGKGFRALGVAYRTTKAFSIAREDEANMVFLGLLIFFDPPKAGMMETLQRLKKLGISLKVITGDSQFVAESVATQVGLTARTILTGRDLQYMSNEALLQQVNNVDVVAEVEPNHKERIILALRKTGNVVGYLGDGINDASALHAADIGISVDSAVDVAKEAADIVLLDKDLNVLFQGVEQGRKTFANTLKYVFMATSANFGNMFSVAGASLFLPYLPLLPKQILLTNFMTDLPEMTIATDKVDKELLEKPMRWNIRFIRNFMITFGILSSVFDYFTFAVLLLVFRAGTAMFRTGWFVESVLSASLVVLVIRSKRLFFKSKPSRYLLTTTSVIAAVALAVPITPIGAVFGFVRLPLSFVILMLGIVALYVIVAEVAKRIFYRYARL